MCSEQARRAPRKTTATTEPTRTGGELSTRGRPVPRDVRRALAYLRGALSEPVAMAELARHCGVSERTLRHHFRIFLGLSPRQYLLRLRLAAVRRALLAAAPGLRVAQLAQAAGFTHFGRFAALYRRQFGETPAQTLRLARSERFAAPQMGRGAAQDVRRDPPVARERPSLAVLPCATPAGDMDLSALSQAVAEAIAAALANVRVVSVVAAPSCPSAALPSQRLARSLPARYLLAGRSLREGTRVRFVLRLIDVTSGEHVWGDSFDGDSARPLELQDRIVHGVLRSLAAGIRGAEIDRARRAPPHCLDAHGLALRALPHVFASQPEATRRALDLLHRAIALDPDYALATALAGWCHGQLVMYNGTAAPEEETQQALALIRRASVLDDGEDALVLAARCAVHTMAREFDIAEALVARALALDPSLGWAWGRSGWLNSYRGQSRAAIAHFSRALAHEPSPAARANSFIGIGSAHFNAGRYEAAAHWLRQALIEQPGASWANRSLSVSYARMGERLKALDALEALRRYSPDLTVGRVMAALPFPSDFLDRLGNGLSELGLPP